MEDHTTTDSTLEILAKLRGDFPTTGAVLQAYLRRTEGDCRRLAEAGYTVRLYTPYGTQWYGYLMRRLAERPANMLFFARALTSRR